MKKSLLLSVILFQFSVNIFAQAGAICWRQISAGQNFSLAIKTDGTLWGWGANSNQLGLGYSGNQNAPIQIGTANDWVTVSAGTVHSLAIKTNGTLWSWGNGQFGALGNGIFNSATWNVTQIGSATDWMSVSAGNRFSLALKTNNTLWSWGLNNTGQLGDGTLVNKNLPNQIAVTNIWAKIDAGNQHSLAIDTSGFVYSWGNNTFGQLGDATNTTSLAPIIVTSSNNYSEISAGLDHSMVLTVNGNLFTFGNNNNGQLCDGTNTASNVFIPIGLNSDGTVTTFKQISAGGGHSLVLEMNNSLWSSGFNTQGQLGLGSNSNSNFLNQVGTSTAFYAISAGDVHSLTLNYLNDLTSTGRGNEGQLGNTTFASANTLQTVSCPTTLATTTIGLNDINLKIYPNPINYILNISFNKEFATVSICNLLGQEILLKTINANETQIDVSSLQSGTYLVKFVADNEVKTMKIFKQ
jgi:alpha-tubulin suppressor-like RCC1 family protein